MISSKLVESKLPCPSDTCGSSDGYHTYDDGHGYCFSCNTYFPSETNVLVLHGQQEDVTYEYLPWRGVSADTFKFYETKTKVKNGKPISLGYQYPNGSFKVRLLDKKEFYSVGDIAKAGLFGRNRFSAGAHKYVCITEGELDAHALYQTLRDSSVPVCSVQSAATGLRDCRVDFDFLNSFEHIVLAFDNDEAGRGLTRTVASLFDARKLRQLKFSKHKDATAYVEAGEENELRSLFWKARAYLPDNIKSSLKDFSDILLVPPKLGIPYPFPSLTSMTYGIRTGESVLFTALEGVGKTELMHHIEAHLLKEIPDGQAVGSIYLEEPADRHLQALAGIFLKKPAHLPDSGVTAVERVQAIKDLVRVDDRLCIYSSFGTDNPDNILDTIRWLVTGANCRYILLDHLNMVCSGLQGEDERRALEYLCTKLEMLVVELDFALIMVSHVNDEGQTRTSRWTAKIANIRVDLKRDALSTDLTTRNTLELSVSKNRYGGLTGPAGKYLFDSYTREYREVNDGHPDSKGPKASNDNRGVRERKTMA